MAKAGSKSTTLPLNDPRWWLFDRAFQYRQQQIGNDVLALDDIQRAVQSGNLPVKIEALDRRTGARVSQLLPGWFFRCQFRITGAAGAIPLHERFPWGRFDVRGQPPDIVWGRWAPRTFFVWGPKVEELWPDHVATQATAIETISTTPADPSATAMLLEPKDWFAQIRKGHSRYQRERAGAYADRLHALMEKAFAAKQVTEVWPRDTLLRRLYDKN